MKSTIEIHQVNRRGHSKSKANAAKAQRKEGREGRATKPRSKQRAVKVQGPHITHTRYQVYTYLL